MKKLIQSFTLLIELEGILRMKAFLYLRNAMISLLFRRWTHCLKLVHRVSKFIHTYDRIKLGCDVISLNTYKRVSSKDNSLFALPIELNGENVIRPGIVNKIFEVTVAMTDKPYEFKKLVCISLDWLRKHPRKTYYGIYSPLQVWDVIYDNDRASMFFPVHAIF